jgi:putative aldouronate transport system permease protein
MAKRAVSDSVARIWMHLFLLVFAALCVVPLMVLLSVSFSEERELVLRGYSLLPRVWSAEAYSYIFRNPAAILNAYWVTVRTTLAGTVLGTLFMSMAAFSLSRRDFTWRRAVTFYLFFTMLFHGGLVPTYITNTRILHLQDTLLVQFLPVMVNAWLTFLLITYMRQIPFELVESAKTDGAREFTIYFRIILPMCKPALATIALLLSLSLWNEWFTSLLYIRDFRLISLQYWMQRVMTNMQFLLMNRDFMGLGSTIESEALPTESVRMAMAVLAAGPMLVAFPFFQKYFAKGLLVGSIKG